MTKGKYLSRYISLSFLLDILYKQRITLIDTKRWEDNNDKHFMNLYKQKIKKETLLALCFVDYNSEKPNAEKYHFWKIYSDGSSGICIVFERTVLENYLKSIKDSNLRFDYVKYYNIDDIENSIKKCQVSWNDLPFTKRSAFSDEREYRIIYESYDNILSKEVTIPLDVISKVIFNPWIPELVYDSVCKVIRKIKDCDNIDLERSTCLEYERWKKAGDEIVAK